MPPRGLAPDAFRPYTPYGYYGVGNTPPPEQTTAEKLAPGPAATKAAATTPPPAKSGGNSGDLTVPGYTPATPTGAPYVPSEPGHSAADFQRAFEAKRRREAHRRLEVELGTLKPLAAPTPTGLVPQSPALAKLQEAVAPSLAEEEFPGASNGFELWNRQQALDKRLLGQVPELHQRVAPTGPSDAQLVADRHVTLRTQRGPLQVPASQIQPGRDPLGRATLGDATIQQLVAASKAGTLRESAKGVLTTPENRNVLHSLLAAKQAYDQSGPGIAALHQAYPELSPAVLKSYRDAARRTGVPPQLLAGIEYQESDYGRSTLPGVQSGQNSAGAAGPFQIGNGTGAAGNAWEGLAQELWGDQADQHSVYNQHDAALAAGQYLSHTYGHATADPSTWQSAAESYNHATWYGEKAVQVAEEHAQLAKLGLPPDAGAAERLEVAKRQALQHGINPTPWNGDVEGGDNEYVYVRADAKGAVNWARSTLGTQEGSARQRHWAELEALGPSEPWCADWVSVNLARRGVELPENPNFSGDYSDPAWKGGTQLGTDISKAKPGDLIVYGADEHIAMYVGDGKVIAGNYGDEVAEYGATEDGRGISAIVRPHYQGGRVKVKAGQVPGSNSESTFGGSTGEAAGGTLVSGGTTGAEGAAQQQAVAREQQAASAQAALAGFEPLGAPSFAAAPIEPQFVAAEEGQTPMSAAQLLQLLGVAAATRS